MSEVKLGELTTKEGKRDAIHVAVIQVCAAKTLEPGTRVWLTRYGSAAGPQSATALGGAEYQSADDYDADANCREMGCD